MMKTILFTRTFAVALVLAAAATGLWAVGAEEEPAAAADKRYVTDPTTGKLVVAPQYGGSIAEAYVQEEPCMDTWIGVYCGRSSVNLVLEKMGIVDWAIDRDEWSLQSNYIPLSVVRGQLAESYDISPDGLTYTFHIRPGVHWQDKAPMNGRELVAEDIVFNFHRITGLGSGFTEKSEYAPNVALLPIESIEATDKYTVVFKLTELNLNALEFIYQESNEAAWIYPPEVIQEHGDAKDWRNLVGTGPYMLTDRAEGSSQTYTKNPNYWGYDEKFPENRLPYLDEVKFLLIPDASTRLSAFRTGKIGRLIGITFDEATAIQRTNPELLWNTALQVPYSFSMDVRKPPFADIRVRHAMQLALDLETINAYWAEIGVDVEIDPVETAVLVERIQAHTFEGMTRGTSGNAYHPVHVLRVFGHSDGEWVPHAAQDPAYDAIVEAAENAGSREEMMDLANKADQYFIAQQWNIFGSPVRPAYYFWQPWMVGYNGEHTLGGGRTYLYLSRVWLDADLREEMTGTR